MSDAEFDVSLPRDWYEPDLSLAPESLVPPLGPDGPFFIAEATHEANNHDLLLVAKLQKDSESTVADLMKLLGMMPATPEVELEIRTTIAAAATMFREEYLSPSGYQTPRYEQKFKDLQEQTEGLNEYSLVEAAHRMLRIASPTPRNIEVEGITRLLALNEILAGA